MGKKKDRSLFPSIPEPLPVPVIDNHTHVGTNRPGQVQNTSETGQPRFPLLIPSQIEFMSRSGIKHAITVGCEIPDLQDVIDLARQQPEFFSAALAIHPNEAPLHAGVTEVGPDGLQPQLKDHHSLSIDEAMAEVARLATDEAVVAIGETGLDYFRTSEAGVESQKDMFRAHVELAKQLDLPLQIHDRDAHEDTVAVLKEVGAPATTVFHCFSGDRELARICAENGWYASFAGPITFPANDYLREAFLAMPEHLVLVETDAPYLTAHPHRGRPNAPYLANLTVRAMADYRGIDLDTWCEQLNTNTESAYRLG